MPTRIIWSVLAALLAGCSGSAGSAKEFATLPERETRATLAGPLCEGTACRCRENPDDDPGEPERPGWKRYAFTIGPVDNELWVMVDGMVLYKSVERPTECFYLDLATGKHAVVLRGEGKRGLGAQLHIAELGALGAYDTFRFSCGAPGYCSLTELDEWQASLASYRRGTHDPCGSTKIRDVSWQSGDTTDRMHPTRLELALVLDVYDFTPKHPSGDPACADKY